MLSVENVESEGLGDCEMSVVGCEVSVEGVASPLAGQIQYLK